MSAMAVLAFFAVSLSHTAGPAHAQQNPVRIVALGDSLTAGYGLAPEQAFPVQLQAALKDAGLDVIVENAGVSGDTTTGGLARLDWALGAEKPELVIVELGANDALRGVPVSTTRANLDQLVSTLKEREIPTLVAGMMAPPNMGDAYGDEFNAIFGELAERYEATLYPFFLDGVVADPTLNLADGIHPTAEGIAIIVERILPSVLEALAEAGHCPLDVAACAELAS
jgi:acyl-CoA thioesterase-1